MAFQQKRRMDGPIARLNEAQRKDEERIARPTGYVYTYTIGRVPIVSRRCVHRAMSIGSTSVVSRGRDCVD